MEVGVALPPFLSSSPHRLRSRTLFPSISIKDGSIGASHSIPKVVVTREHGKNEKLINALAKHAIHCLEMPLIHNTMTVLIYPSFLLYWLVNGSWLTNPMWGDEFNFAVDELPIQDFEGSFLLWNLMEDKLDHLLATTMIMKTRRKSFMQEEEDAQDINPVLGGDAPNNVVEVERDARNRKKLRPYENTFYNKSEVHQVMFNAIHSYFEGPWRTFTQVPPHVKQHWWEEVQKEKHGRDITMEDDEYQPMMPAHQCHNTQASTMLRLQGIGAHVYIQAIMAFIPGIDSKASRRAT